MKLRQFAPFLLVGVTCSAIASLAQATVFTTYITGETDPGTALEKHVIFTVTFNPAVASSGTVVTTLVDPIHRLDGIDFVPGTGFGEVVAAGTYLPTTLGSPDGVVGHYDVAGGVVLAPYIPSTKLVLTPPSPALTATHPSTVKSTPTHFYYTENQFGFEGFDPHRILRKTYAVGPPPAEIVFDGAAPGAGGLVQFEGLEIVGSRLYFFTRDPGDATKRALVSIKLTPGGLWDTTDAPSVELAGLSRGAPAGIGPGASDGSDELDFDPVTGLIWGTNIITGELIAFDPAFGGAPAGGGAVVVSAAAVAGGLPGGLGLLGKTIDGIRSTGEGHLVFVGLEGVIASIDLAGFIGGGGLGFGSITDADMAPLLIAPGVYAFDDLTPLYAVPEPSTLLLSAAGLAGLALIATRRRRVRQFSH